MMGGPAPVRRFLPDLMDRVLKGKIKPGKVFDLELPMAKCRRLSRDGRAARDQGAGEGLSPARHSGKNAINGHQTQRLIAFSKGSDDWFTGRFG